LEHKAGVDAGTIVKFVRALQVGRHAPRNKCPDTEWPQVPFGSKADRNHAQVCVRFTPQSGYEIYHVTSARHEYKFPRGANFIGVLMQYAPIARASPGRFLYS
jgi:hypothetical protein